MSSIKVKFLPSGNPGGQGRILYRISHERHERQLLTDYRLYAAEWNMKSGVVVEDSAPSRRDYLQSVIGSIQTDLINFRKVLSELMRRKEPFAIDTLVACFERRRCRKSFFAFMESVIARLRLMGRHRTSETYTAAYNSFNRFANGRCISFDDITPEMMEMYQAYLTNRGLVLNTISFHMRILRAVYNRACDNGLVDDRRPFRHVYTGVEKTKKRAISITTLRKIKNIDLTDAPAADYARDIFLLSFYFRGMSFVDMAFLRKSDLHDGYITYRRRKTGQRLSIKWTHEMEQILRKYTENITGYLLPIITSTTVSPYRQYRLCQYRVNRALKQIGSRVGLEMPLTFYCSRHSWASIAKAKGVPVGVICDGLGHDSELTTQIYLSTLDVNAVDRANALILKSL